MSFAPRSATRPWIGWTLLLTAAGLAVPAVPRAAAQASAAPYSVLHAFSAANRGNNADGVGPRELIQGGGGFFYGAASAGGANGTGTVFKVAPDGTLTTLHAFSALVYTPGVGASPNSDGNNPTAGLALGSDGALYGGTGTGGTNRAGTIYKVTPDGTFTAIHSFDAINGIGNGESHEGFNPTRLVPGADGNLYGTNNKGGDNGNGTVFRVTPDGGLTVLHEFGATTPAGASPDGVNPGPLSPGTDGYFYGTARGGTSGAGVFYRIAPDGTFTLLHTFGGNPFATTGEGALPDGGVTPGPDGYFYGATSLGGANGNGTVYKIALDGTVTTLHSFGATYPRTATNYDTANPDGANPSARLVTGRDGNFYGTAPRGGANGNGTVFKLTPDGGLTVEHVFSAASVPGAPHDGPNGDGLLPIAALIQAGDGRLYGACPSGGSGGNGVLFALTPGAGHPAFFSGESPLTNGAYYLGFFNGDFFGYYSYLADPHYLFHFDLGYEYVFDAADDAAGVYLYDFKSSGFFYTAPTYPFPYLYDYSLNSVVYYYGDPSNPGRYNTNGIRYFYVFNTGQIITK